MAFDRSALLPGAKFLNVTVNGKPAKMAVANMDDATLRAALMRSDNKGFLAPGWTSGPAGVYKAAVAPPAPEVITTPKPGWTAPPPTPLGQPPAPIAPVTPPPVPPVAPPPPPPRPTEDQFANYQDSQYWDDLSSYQRQYDDANAEVTSKLTGLNTRIDPITGKVVTAGVGGKTLYDLLYDKQNATTARNVSLSRSDAARKGVITSGYMDRTAADIASSDVQARDGLIRQYGTDTNDVRSAAYGATQQQSRLQQQFAEAKRLLAKSASARGWQSALSQYNTTYGGYS